MNIFHVAHKYPFWGERDAKPHILVRKIPPCLGYVLHQMWQQRPVRMTEMDIYIYVAKGETDPTTRTFSASELNTNRIVILLLPLSSLKLSMKLVRRKNWSEIYRLCETVTRGAFFARKTSPVH